MNKKLNIPTLKCLRCGHEWIPNRPIEPKVCPKCNSPYWNKPRVKITKVTGHRLPKDETFVVEALQGEVNRVFPNDVELQKSIPAMFALFSRVRLPKERRAIGLSLELIDEAIVDIESCKVLLANKVYSRAVYSFHKAIEKAVKAYMLGFGMLNLKEYHGHNTPELFLRLFDKVGLSALSEGIEPKIAEQIKSAKKAIDKEKSRQEIALLDYKTIMNHLSVIPKFEHEGLATIDTMTNALSKVTGIEPPKPNVLESLPTLMRLTILAIDSFPHWEYTDYPDRAIKPANYNESTGIVQALPELMDTFEPAAKWLKLTLSSEEVISTGRKKASPPHK